MTDVSMTPEVRNKPNLKQEIAFALVHLLPLAALYTGATIFRLDRVRGTLLHSHVLGNGRLPPLLRTQVL